MSIDNKSPQPVPRLTPAKHRDWATYYLFHVLPKSSSKIVTSFCAKKADETFLRFTDRARINVHQYNCY